MYSSTRGEEGAAVGRSEVFDATRHVLVIVGLLFGQRVRTRAWDGCSAGRNATIKESGTRSDGMSEWRL